MKLNYANSTWNEYVSLNNSYKVKYNEVNVINGLSNLIVNLKKFKQIIKLDILLFY